MTKIDANEPSKVEVNAPGKPALSIIQSGSGDGTFGILALTVTPGKAVAIRGISNQSEGSPPEPNLGVWGESKGPQGGTGVIGVTTNGTGIHGVCRTGGVAVGGESRSDNGVAIRGAGKGLAGQFLGNVEVTGDIRLLNADCAEDFDVADSESKENIEPGTVMVLTENGSLQQSYREYDKKVAGIISGAGGYKPAIVLDRQDHDNNKGRLPIALVGKVYCKVDARNSSIEIGDLLTTSSTNGYAMKAQDPMKAFGAVIGKALGSIKEGGMGMIPVLVALQ